MRRNAVPAVLARLVASLFVVLALIVAPAGAADRALINMLGYSAEGNYFGFEQFGIHDGSGFAFSEVFIVDLAHDKWTAGTPFEVQAADEEEPLAEVRAEAMAKARDKLDEYKIGVPVQILALIGEGEASRTGKRMSWSTPACCGPGYTQTDAFDLLIENRGISSTEEYCKDMSPVGFNLTYQDQFGHRELHMDGDVLPPSRGCTLDYRIYAVVEPFEDYYAEGFDGGRVAIIATYPFGFEGVDRRFLVVPIDK
jgi:predicted secreted protein